MTDFSKGSFAQSFTSEYLYVYWKLTNIPNIHLGILQALPNLTNKFLQLRGAFEVIFHENSSEIWKIRKIRNFVSVFALFDQIYIWIY